MARNHLVMLYNDNGFLSKASRFQRNRRMVAGVDEQLQDLAAWNGFFFGSALVGMRRWGEIESGFGGQEGRRSLRFGGGA